MIATIAPVDSQERFEGLGVHVIREFGSSSPRPKCRQASTSSRPAASSLPPAPAPFVPPIPGVDDVPYYTNETIFDLREQPEHLLVIGGGPIGMEMAQAHLRLGSKVTVIEG